MSDTKASVGQGAIFYTGGASSGSATYVAILELQHVAPPEETVAEVEVTHLLSAGNAKEFIPAGVFDAGMVEISGSYLGDTTQEGMITTLEAGTIIHWKITSGANISASKTCTITGNGFFTKLKRGPFEVGKANQITGTLKITGPITTVVA